MVSGKRGDVSPIMLVKIGLLVLAAVALIIAVTLMYNIIFSSEGEAPSLNSFKSLHEAVAGGVSASEGGVFIDKAYHISPSFILVGFGSKQDSVFDRCGAEEVRKPKVAGCSGACLCLYEETGGDIDFDVPEIKECLPLDSKVQDVITLNYYNPEKNEVKYLSNKDSDESRRIWQNVGGNQITSKEILGEFYSGERYGDYEYADFFVYGQCRDFSSDISIEVPKFILEVVNSNGKSTVLVVAQGTLDYEKRKEALFKSFRKTNENPA
ncbi:MAG: hypothetical protein AABW87_00030 [Nanoarchaeota archaeon]